MEKAKRVATSTPQPLVTPLLDSLGLSSGKKNEQEVYVQAATKCKPTLRPCSVHQTYPFLSSHNEGLSKSWGPQNHPRPSKTIQFPIEHGHVDVGVPHQKKHQKKTPQRHRHHQPPWPWHLSTPQDGHHAHLAGCTGRPMPPKKKQKQTCRGRWELGWFKGTINWEPWFFCCFNGVHDLMTS